MPGTPRASTPNGLRRSASRERYSQEPLVDIGRALHASHPRIDGRAEPGRYGGGGLDTFAVEHLGVDTFTTSAEGGRGSKAAALAPALTPARAVALADAGRPMRTPPTQARGSVFDRSGSRDGGHGYFRYPTDTSGGKPSQVDARSGSFVRLNNFLLRTHVTSLVSALAEDGWLEVWEKERLCSQARDDSPAWAQSFLGGYTRFMETEDVPAFVASLRSQIV